MKKYLDSKDEREKAIILKGSYYGFWIIVILGMISIPLYVLGDFKPSVKAITESPMLPLLYIFAGLSFSNIYCITKKAFRQNELLSDTVVFCVTAITTGSSIDITGGFDSISRLIMAAALAIQGIMACVTLIKMKTEEKQ